MNSRLPSISGTPRQFETLTADPGLWTGGVSSFAYQWFRCSTANSCAVITGATAASYTLTHGDIGSTIKVRVSATGADGTTVAESALTGPIKIGVVTARLSVEPNPTCTGLTVHIDGSSSVSPDGIAAYKISLVSLEDVGALTEGDARNGAVGNGFALLGGAMSADEIYSRTYATYPTSNINVTFTWNRPNLPAYPGDPAGFTYFARDPVGVVLDVRDFAGATDRAVSAVVFAQEYSDQSRSGCPHRSAIAQRLVLPYLQSLATLDIPARASAKTSKLTTTLSCAQRVACTGELSVTPLASSRCVRCAADGAPAAARRPTARGPTVIARSFFTIAAHRKKRIACSLTAAGLRSLRSLRHGASRRLRVTITVVGPTGRRLVHAYTITVKRK